MFATGHYLDRVVVDSAGTARFARRSSFSTAGWLIRCWRFPL
jgi:hypothetical protein